MHDFKKGYVKHSERSGVLHFPTLKAFSKQRMLIGIRSEGKGENTVLKHLLENKPKERVENLMRETPRDLKCSPVEIIYSLINRKATASVVQYIEIRMKEKAMNLNKRQPSP